MLQESTQAAQSSDESEGTRIVYTLSTSEKEDWVLVFDVERYWPENGVRGFHLQQVSVTGELLSDGTLLVESISTD